jgi:hypothetical protein
MFAELVDADIVKKFVPAKISDLLGEDNFLGCV